MKLASKILTIAAMAMIPLLFNNCGASFVVNSDGSIAQSVFPESYQAYGNIPSQTVNLVPNVSTRIPLQAAKANSGLAPTSFTYRTGP